MRGGNATLEQSRELVEIEFAAEGAERWRAAFDIGAADRMALATEFLQELTAVPQRVRRLRQYDACLRE